MWIQILSVAALSLCRMAGRSDDCATAAAGSLCRVTGHNEACSLALDVLPTINKTLSELAVDVDMAVGIGVLSAAKAVDDLALDSGESLFDRSLNLSTSLIRTRRSQDLVINSSSLSPLNVLLLNSTWKNTCLMCVQAGEIFYVYPPLNDVRSIEINCDAGWDFLRSSRIGTIYGYYFAPLECEVPKILEDLSSLDMIYRDPSSRFYTAPDVRGFYPIPDFSNVSHWLWNEIQYEVTDYPNVLKGGLQRVLNSFATLYIAHDVSSEEVEEVAVAAVE